jgi:hypothetical protein
LINDKPRPRVLVHGFDSTVVAALAEFIPTVRSVATLAEVRLAEWDAVVSDEEWLLGVDEHLFAIIRAPLETATVGSFSSSSWVIESETSPSLLVQMFRGHVADEFLRYPNLPDRVRHLTHEVLEPVVMARDRHNYFTAIGSDQVGLRPFLATSAGQVLAGSYTRRSGAEVWLLPHDVPDIVPWVRAAIAEWHHLAPGRFPGVPDWSHEPRWQTHDERRRVRAVATLDTERRHINDHLEQRAANLHNQLDSARAEGDLYERALLTADSEELVDAVIKALRELGFTVINADDHAAPGDNLEDLHITDSDDSTWLAIAEVKGYTKGAQTAAFQQLARFNARYVQRTGVAPSAEWYIANQFRKQDPSTRQPILHNKSEDIQTFALASGLIIDTVTLFRILDHVRVGHITRTEARTHLRSTTGILIAPPW